MGDTTGRWNGRAGAGVLRAPGFAGAVGLTLPVVAALLAWASPCPAAWPADPATNLSVSTAAISQDDPQVIPDGSGGAIIAWQATISTGQGRVFAQRITRAGRALWGSDGVAVCSVASGQLQPALAADSSGGAIIAWQDDRSGRDWDIYAQRIDGDGTVRWAREGVRVSCASGDQLVPSIASDGHGGALIGWQDLRTDKEADLYAQALDGAGQARWSPDGVPIFAGPGAQLLSKVVASGMGGATFIWMDSRGGPETSGIYAQRVDAAGSLRWNANGVLVVDGVSPDSHPVAFGDDQGCLVVAWESGAIHAQRLDAGGRADWGPGGKALSTSDGRAPALVPDGAGGAIVAWQTASLDADASDIRAQSVRASGALRWGTDGTPVCQASGAQAEVVAVPAPAGGAIILWRDARNDRFGDFYGQRIDSTGTALWQPDGAVVSDATGLQEALAACADGDGGAIAAWSDGRTGRHLYAQRVSASGRLGSPRGKTGPEQPR